MRGGTVPLDHVRQCAATMESITVLIAALPWATTTGESLTLME